MADKSNPVVQNALSRLNAISSSAGSRIWSGNWIQKDPIPVYEYIQDGIGVVREQTTGALVSILSRMGTDFDKLQRMVEAGKGKWLR